MLTSVVVPVYQAAASLAPCVDSILREAGRHPVEVVLVDDGSTDGGLALAERLARAHAERVRLLRHPDGMNRGPGASRNAGIRAARGDVICFLDADDVWLPGRLDACLEILAARPEIDGVVEAASVRIESARAAKDWGARPLLIPPPGRALERGAVVPFDRIARGESLWHTGCIALRPSLLARTGLFSESLRLGEDKELWLRLAATGNLVAGDMARPVALYRRCGSSLSTGAPGDRVAAEVLGSVHAWGRGGLLSAARLRLVEMYRVRALLRSGALGEARRFARDVGRPHLPLVVQVGLCVAEVPGARPLARWWRTRASG